MKINNLIVLCLIHTVAAQSIGSSFFWSFVFLKYLIILKTAQPARADPKNQEKLYKTCVKYKQYLRSLSISGEGKGCEEYVEKTFGEGAFHETEVLMYNLLPNDWPVEDQGEEARH